MTPGLVAIGTPTSFRGVTASAEGYPRHLGAEVWRVCQDALALPYGLWGFASSLLGHERWECFAACRRWAPELAGVREHHPNAINIRGGLGFALRARAFRDSSAPKDHVTEATDEREPVAYGYCVDPATALLRVWRYRGEGGDRPPFERYRRHVTDTIDLRGAEPDWSRIGFC